MMTDAFDVRLYPAFQLIYELENQNSSSDKSVFGAEVLARTSISDLKFDRPDTLGWADVDTRLAQVLIRGRQVLSAENTLFLNASQQSLQDCEVFFKWLVLVSAIRRNKAVKAVVIEIAEDVNHQTLLSRWDMLQECGIRLAFDKYSDTGASFKRLTSFPWDYCKVVMGEVTDKTLDKVTDYFWKAKITGIAMKIETESESAVAYRHGLKIQQGFYFSQPKAQDILNARQKYVEVR